MNNETEIIEEFDDLDSAESVNELDVDNNNVNLKLLNPGDFINTDLVPVKKIKCIVPEKLLKTIRKIEKCVNMKLKGTPEFSIYIHGEFDLNGNYIVSEDFYIPKQNVSTASVDYLEDPDPYYNGCLHKHPDGCKSFSGTDDKYINSNFEFSLLYVCKSIQKGIINLKYHSIFRLQTDLNVVIDEDVEETEFDISNINKPAPKIPPCFPKPVVQDKQKLEQKIDAPVLPYFDPNLFRDPEMTEAYPYHNFDF
jgi:hypothetical protein